MDAVQAVPASGPLRSLNFDHFQIANSNAGCPLATTFARPDEGWHLFH